MYLCEQLWNRMSTVRHEPSRGLNGGLCLLVRYCLCWVLHTFCFVFRCRVSLLPWRCQFAFDLWDEKSSWYLSIFFYLCANDGVNIVCYYFFSSVTWLDLNFMFFTNILSFSSDNTNFPSCIWIDSLKDLHIVIIAIVNFCSSCTCFSRNKIWSRLFT